MSDRDLRNLYENVRRGGEYVDPPRRESDLYKHVYIESKGDPIVKGDEATMTVFFSEDPEVIKQLYAMQGVQVREMSQKYFNAGILGRLDEQMSKIVTKLVTRAVGKMDPVALRGVYDVFQSYHIPGHLVKQLHTNLASADDTKNIRGDMLVSRIANITQGHEVIDIIPLLAENCIQYGFSPERDLNSFISELWEVKDVEGRTSVGKGELAMSCLTVCRKGEPGDIKAGNQDDDPDGDAINVSLVVGDKKQPILAVEVKGLGGRPGTEGYGRNFFVRDVINVLNKLPKPSVEELANTKYTQEQLQAADDAVTNKFKRNSFATQKQKVLDSLRSGRGPAPQEIIDQVSAILDTVGSENYYTELKKYADYMLTSGKKIAGLDPNYKGTGGGGVRLDTMHQFKMSVLADGANLMKDLAFKEGVETFFINVLPTLSVQPTPEQVANLIWSLRTDNVSMPDDLKNTLIEMYVKNELGTNNLITLKQLVGAIQMTSYCGHDGFTHAMFVNDNNQNKRSLIVATNKSDLNTTFLNLFEAFKSNNVDCPLSIDKQNKGVQIKFTQ